MQFTNKTTQNFNYKMKDQYLQIVRRHPYLGLELDDKLTWKHHIHNIKVKANRTLNFLHRNMQHSPQQIKEKLYHTLVKPILEYCSPIWDPHTHKHIKLLEQIQHKAARFVTNTPYNRERREDQKSGTTLTNKLNWPPLLQRRKLQRLTLLYKIHHGQIAIPKEYLPPTAENRTRHSHNKKYQIPYSNIDTHKYSSITRSIPEWNKLPQYVVDLNSTEDFKTAVEAIISTQSSKTNS